LTFMTADGVKALKTVSATVKNGMSVDLGEIVM